MTGGYAGIDDIDDKAGFGNGGAASLVSLGSSILVSAGGGGGGGGGGGSDNGLYPGAGGDGGNGGGYRGYAGHASHSGGVGGAVWSFVWFDAGAGGGGAGGASYSIDANAVTSSATTQTNGQVTITYATRYETHGEITATVPNPSLVGTPIRITPNLSWSAAAPGPTGSIVFGRVDPNTGLDTDVEYWDASINSSPMSYPTVYPVGREQLYVYYTGDEYHTPWRENYIQDIVAPVSKVTAAPATLAFGAQPLNTTTTHAISVKNTGNVPITPTYASFSRSEYKYVVGGTCKLQPLAPGSACTYTIAFTPTTNAALNATLTVSTNSTVTASANLTGRGLVAPTVKAISPKSGPLAGGTVVTVTGTSLQRVSAIKFGAVSGTNLSCPTATKCTVTAPRRAARGIVNVRVANAAGTSAVATADRFTYV